ncbi:MAG: AAA family ATPase [Acidimicrobiia bacterium]|nr:AAA family ATPase [Acidimicrobiia bacterium]
MSDTLELRAPRSMDQLDIPQGLVQDLTLRRALFEGRTSTLKLSTTLCLSPQLMTEVIDELRDLRLMEVLGLEGHNYILTLTEYGREQANDRLGQCRYAAAAPVGLDDYRRVVNAQTAHPTINRQVMVDGFNDLVINTRLLDQLGPALISEGAMFLYGPPGTGKSSIAERLNRIHTDHVLVPRAVEVDSQIITVFDPVIHVPMDPQPTGIDPRWVLCSRPAILTGGELTNTMLDLTYESTSGVYLAPLQMQANNGILVIDDFGRQQITPEALLNRWIVPLDRRVDYLSLSYGMKFQIPFDVKVVFSTNLEPSDLGDEAFFRRIQSKILVPSIADDEFDEVLRRAAVAFDVTIPEDSFDYLRKVSREMGDGDLRPYLPREVCRILRSVSVYNGTPPVLDRSAIEQVASVYFTQAAEMRGNELLEQLRKPGSSSSSLPGADASSHAPGAEGSPESAAPAQPGAAPSDGQGSDGPDLSDLLAQHREATGAPAPPAPPPPPPPG